jgi:hypothetical protein
MVDHIIDTSAMRKGWGGLSAKEMLAPYVRTKLANKYGKEKSATLAINQAFLENRLFVMEHCSRTHKELMLNTYRKNRADPQKVLEEPEDKWNDCLDGLRYIFTERPSFQGLAQIKSRVAPYAQL